MRDLKSEIRLLSHAVHTPTPTDCRVVARAFSNEAAGLACSSEMASDARESCAMIVILIVGG